MAGPPAGPPFLRPGWVSQRPPQVWPAQPALPDQGRLRHKHKHRMCLACRLFAARPEENRGKLLSKLHGPSETMRGTKFSREPGRARASQPGAFVPAPEREQCPAARLEAGSGPIPQFGSLEPPGGVRRPVAWGASGQRIQEPLPAPLLSPAAASAPCPSPWENVARRADRSSCRRGGVGGRCPALGFLSHTPALVGQRLHQALAQGSSARPPCLGPLGPDAGPSSSLLRLVSRSAPARRPGLSWPRH